MAADSDGSGDSLTTVVTCEGDLHDPDFPAKFELILDKLRGLLCSCDDDQEAGARLCVRKLEPWNSVRVTLAIPRDAALRLRQLASEGSQQLRALGILSVQVEGDQVISLRLASRFGQEPQEIVLRTGTQETVGVSTQPTASDGGGGVVSGLTRILSGSQGTVAASTATATHSGSSLLQLPSTSAVAPTAAAVATVAAAANVVEASTSATTDKVQFRSPNVVCPTDTQVPKVPPSVVPPTTPASGPAQRNYNGPFPFASMTHAAQAIHSRENQTFTQPQPPPPPPPPPYPSQPPPPKPPANTINPTSPNVAMSSPLLVNLLQNDGAAQTQNKMLPPPPSSSTDQRKTFMLKQQQQQQQQNRVVEEHEIESGGGGAIKYPVQMGGVVNVNSISSGVNAVVSGGVTSNNNNNNNSTVPTPNSNIMQTSNSSAHTLAMRSVGPRLQQQQFVQQKINTQVPVPVSSVRPQHQQPAQAQPQVRPVRTPISNQKFPVTPVSTVNNVQFGGAQFPRQNFRGQIAGGQFAASQQQQSYQQQNFQQFPSPPPYPRQRMETPRSAIPDISRFQQQQQRVQQSNWPQQLDSNVTPVGQPMPSLTGLSQIGNLQPIAQPMPHLGSLSSVLDSSLSNITPSLTDLSKTDLDSILPSLEGELVDSTPDIPDIPESLTSTGKRRQYLINPLTGVLEPMPSDSSGSESETEEAKETTDIFNDFNSPINEKSSSIYSDDDTCSTTISRKFDTTDQSDSEATVKSTNSENSVKSHQRIKSGKNRDRNRDSPNLKKNKDLPTEKIKLRLKLEKSEPVSPAYKVDISFINTQQPKRATQNIARPASGAVPPSPTVPCSAPSSVGEELRVPPLHISLRGRNSVVINSEKKKKYPKLNPDGTVIELKKSKKTLDGLKMKKCGSLLPTALSKSDSSLISQKIALMKPTNSDLTLPGTSDVKMNNDIVKSDNKSVKSNSDLDEMPLKHRMREPGEIVSLSKPVKTIISADLKKSKKLNKLNHLDLYREQNLLTGGHLVDDYKLHKKPKCDDKIPLKNPHKVSSDNSTKLNSHFKKEKLKEKPMKDRILPGHVGEIRRGSDSDVVKGMKRHAADSNGLLQIEKKRRLSQSELKTNTSTTTESQGVNKSVKLKSCSTDGHITSLSQTTTSLHQTVVGSTNVGTITTISNKSLSKSTSSSSTSANNSKLQKPAAKVRRDKVTTSFMKTKEGSFKSKDLNRDKTYAQNVAEKLAKQLPLPVGEIDMEAKFKQSLLESSTELSRRITPAIERKSDVQNTLDRTTVTDLVQNLIDSNQKTSVDAVVVDTRQKDEKKEQQSSSPDRKSTETDLPQTQTQSGRSPNSGGQGEDSGIESMDALSEKSPNQASQSPHSHTDITEMKTVKNETKLENCLPDLLDIEEQLAKMDGLPTLNGDISHMIKTEPFMKTETLIEKLEGTEGKDMNENKEHVKEAILDECCGTVQKTDCKIEISDLPLTTAMQESLKQGNISVTTRAASKDETESKEKLQPDLEISLVSKKFNCCDDVQKIEIECKTLKNESSSTKDLDFDPLPIRRKPPLYTYSNPEKQNRDSDSPIPNLSDLEYDNSDSNSECSELKSKISQKAVTVTRRRKQNLDNIQLNDSELDTCLEAMGPSHYLTDLTGFKKNNDIIKKSPKSLLEQLLIEIPSEITEKQVSSTSPSVSEKSLNTSKSSIRTRSSSKLNSPDISESSKSEKSIKTPRHSPVILKQDSPANSPTVLCPSKASPKLLKTGNNSNITTVKRKRQESESSTQSNVSLDETGTRNKKTRKCSENAVELIKACIGVEHTAKPAAAQTKDVVAVKKQPATTDKNNKQHAGVGLLRKTQLVEIESSDSDEPLIEMIGKVRNKHVATRNKLNSTKSNLASSVKSSVPVVSSKVPASVVGEEKTVNTRRSVRNNAATAASSTIAALKTRSKLQQQLIGDKTTGTGTSIVAANAVVNSEMDANRRKTRSAVSDDGKRRRNSRDGK